MTRDAIKEREQLRAERLRAREAHDQHVERLTEIRRELKSLPRDRTATLRDAARAGKPGDVEKMDARERELREELESETRAMRAATDAGRAAEGELVRLHHDRFAEFAEHAESLTEDAAKKLAGLERSYAAAHGAIEAARSEWQRIVTDYNATLAGRLNPAEKAAGELRRQRLSAPPDNPLPAPTEVYSAPPIRPAEVEPVDEAA